MLFALACLIILNLIYQVGYFSSAIALKVTEDHYFFGFNPKLFSFKIRKTGFTIGLYIPIIWLGKVYKVMDGKKQRVRYPWEFANQSLINRFLVTISGTMTLLLFGLLILVSFYYFQKVPTISKDEVNRHGIYPSAWAKELGFHRGDKVIAVNGKDYEQYYDLIDPKVLSDTNSYYTILRDHEELKIKIKTPSDTLSERVGRPFISLLAPFEVSSVLPGSPADKAGILPHDRIIKVNGQPIIKFYELDDQLKRNKDGLVSLEIRRQEGDSVKTVAIDLVLASDSKMGIHSNDLITYTYKKNTLAQAIQKSAKGLTTAIGGIIKLSKPNERIKGPIAVTSQSQSYFWVSIGVYAIWYSLCNLLPLPKSCLWEIIALAYEMLSRRKYPGKAFKISIYLAWAFPIAIIVLIFLNDISTIR